MGCCLWGRTESDTTAATQQQQQQKHNFESQGTVRRRKKSLGAGLGEDHKEQTLFINSFIQKIYIELYSYPKTGANSSESQQDLRRTEISTTTQN